MDIGPPDEPLTVEQARDYIKELIIFLDGNEDIRLLALAHEIVSQIECTCAPRARPELAQVVNVEFGHPQA